MTEDIINIVPLRETPEEVRGWVHDHLEDILPPDQSAFQAIIDNVVPELCGYAIALLAAKGGD